MTTPKIRSLNDSSLPASSSTFVKFEREFSLESAGTATRAEVIRMETFYVSVPQRAGFKEIDELNAAADADPVRAALMAAARQKFASMIPKESPITLALLRLRAGFSQAKLGEITGTKQNRISLYETGKADMWLDTAKRLAAALNVSLDELNKALENSRSDTP